jgi:hypothetical protein
MIHNSSSEVMRHRKELVHAKTQIQDLQEELEEKTNLYIKAISVSAPAPSSNSLRTAMLTGRS